jgi:hypothetical protein
MENRSSKWDISMLVPEKEMQNLNPETHDPTIVPPSQAKPSLYDKRKSLREKTSYCARRKGMIHPGVSLKSAEYFPTKWWSCTTRHPNHLWTVTLPPPYTSELTTYQRLDSARPGTCIQAKMQGKKEC